MNSHTTKKDTPLLQVPGSDNSFATAIQQNLGSSEMPAANPLEAAADDLQPAADKSAPSTSAPPSVNGAVGGKKPQTNGSKFDEAVSQADSDFAQNQTNQNPTNQNQQN